MPSSRDRACVPLEMEMLPLYRQPTSLARMRREQRRAERRARRRRTSVLARGRRLFGSRDERG